VRLVASLGAAIVLAAAALLPGAAPAAPRTLLAVIEGTNQRALVRVDARTLVPVGERLPLGVLSGPFVRSPDDLLLAVGAGSGIAFLDPAAMRNLGEMHLKPYPNVAILNWPSARVLFAQTCCPDTDRLLVVDPTTRRVVARAPLWFDTSGTATLPDAIAYLASPSNRIGPASVIAIGADGNSQLFVPFSRISAGRHWHKVRGVQVLEIRQPGFTVDPDRRIAYVVASSNLAAELDLRTGAVAYHALAVRAARTLAQTQKEFNGTTRYARWLGNGLIAVAGVRHETRILRNGSLRTTTKPAGVALLDTHTWRMQMLDPDASGFVADNTHLLALKARAVEVFTTDGVRRMTIPIDGGFLYAQVFDGLAYLSTQKSVTVVDLDAGAVVATLPRPQLFLIGSL
jgi:hypothetical protein